VERDDPAYPHHPSCGTEVPDQVGDLAAGPQAQQFLESALTLLLGADVILRRGDFLYSPSDNPDSAFLEAVEDGADPDQ
jgi:hypothetical protein